MTDPAIPSEGHRDARVLAACQGLYIAAVSIDLTLTALTGHLLAPDKSLATLPFALITVASAVVTWFAALLIQRIGRRAGFTLGALAGTAGGAVSVWAVFHANFWVFCAGTALVGAYQAFAQFYRLAAADSVAAPDKSRAVSTVLAGGVIAAIAGPVLAAWSKDLFPMALFAGAYLMVAVLGALSVVLILAFYRDTQVQPAQGTPVDPRPPRPLREIARQPIYIAALANNVVGSVSMMFVMTAAPLAAVASNHTINDGAGIMQWHLVGVFAPALFAGALIRRWGLARVLSLGMTLNVVCVVIAINSTALPAFYAALLCLGVGWNFMFVGGTTLLAQSYR
ncbi:MAG: MFS transporter, partial [Pseudomonadota bacterium]|nr:MFS transporter [Pseudomonadota bacterium]